MVLPSQALVSVHWENRRVQRGRDGGGGGGGGGDGASEKSGSRTSFSQSVMSGVSQTSQLQHEVTSPPSLHVTSPPSLHVPGNTESAKVGWELSSSAVKGLTKQSLADRSSVVKGLTK
eukprot:5523379-Pyramimonas_sp.AAC.1